MNVDRLRHLAVRLDRHAATSDDVLATRVGRDGACFDALADGEVTLAVGRDRGSDAVSAARVCAGCPVQEQCLELELRTLGHRTAGPWGALPESERRALFPYWRARRQSSGGGGAR